MLIEFSPLIPPSMMIVAIGLSSALVALGVVQKVRGAWIRALGLVALLLALANPVIFQEEREQLQSVVAVVVDRSQSQKSPDRIAQTDAVIDGLRARFERLPRFDLRVVEAEADETSTSPSTRLFEALQAELQDVPTARIGGAIMVTDGQVHDIPEAAAQLGFDAPVHSLITGSADETDRRIEVVRSPRFGIVGEDQELVYRVVDDGASNGGSANVTIFVNGELLALETVELAEERSFNFEVPRAGNNIIELSVDLVPDEISEANNHTVAIMDGIRENLRVLLVSGEPHAGERAWRNLLKSDASVDLVHFTILRPPEKQDGTPISELSLIAFPTRELFVEKIDQFDLIVFDRYQRRGVLPVLYYDYIAQYVEAGGALLIAAGPEHAANDSVAQTPLAPILPARPTGRVRDIGFFPRLSEDGVKHPVTRGLPGSISEPPRWGRWFRSIEVDTPLGSTILNGPDGSPLLVLDRAGEGRVAMLLSDHGWLWARGFEGGGPHVALYRRIAHWLMKEPALEEEALTARALGRTLEISRQTMGETAGPARIYLPSGVEQEIALDEVGSGIFKTEIATTETGLYRIEQGDYTALVHIGAVDAAEFAATVSTPELLRPIAEETGGLVQRVTQSGATAIPTILPVRGSVRDRGDSRMSLKVTDETVLKGVDRLPLFAGFLGLALLLFALGSTWYREGR